MSTQKIFSFFSSTNGFWWVSFLLLGYIGYLLGANYLALVQLQETARERFALEVEQQSQSIGYYFSERIRDITRLSERPELQHYFANKALGMTLSYGLQASLNSIEYLFQSFQDKDQGYDITYWTSIALVTTKGQVLVGNVEPKLLQNKEHTLFVQKTRILSVQQSEPKTVIISSPVFFKGKHAGQVIAWCSIGDMLHKPDVLNSDSAQQCTVLIGSNQNLFLSGQKTCLSMASLLNWAHELGHKKNQVHVNHFADFYAVSVQIQNTPYSLLSVLPVKQVLGDTPPWKYILGILAIIGLGLVVVMVISRHSEQKVHLSEINASRERYRSLVETMNEGFFIVDLHGRFTYVNQQFCHLLQKEPSALLNHELSDFLENDSPEIFKACFYRAESAAENFELMWLRADGSRIHTLISPAPLWDRGGKAGGFFTVVTDITELKSLQSQLLQAKKLEAIGQLAAGVAHEINTPIQYVNNNLKYIQEVQKDLFQSLPQDLTGPGQIHKLTDSLSLMEEKNVDLQNDAHVSFLYQDMQEAVSDSLAGLDHIAKIVDSIKDFSYPKQDVQQPVDLNEVIENAIVVSKNEWKYVADLHTELDPELPKIQGFRSELNQVFLNMIVNAAHAIKEKKEKSEDKSLEKGYIFLQSERNSNTLNITIADNGAGIPSEIQDKIFDPFFTTKDVGQGTGQGLAISYRVITEKHGGSIRFETKRHAGTTFFISLPIS
jgi:PAS domain S-box-containing protein